VLGTQTTDFGGDDPGLPGYRVLEYCDRMDLAFAAADLVVCRSGSATVSELAAARFRLDDVNAVLDWLEAAL